MLWHAGCTVALSNDGEVGFRQCTSWGFFHTAKATGATSEAHGDVPALVEAILGEINKKQEAATLADEPPVAPVQTKGNVSTEALWNDETQDPLAGASTGSG